MKTRNHDDSLNKFLNYKLGKLMPPIAIYGGYLFILIGIISIFFGNPYLGAGIILLGILISFTFRGVIIDIQKRELLTFTSVFWIKRDKQVKDLTQYQIITVNRTSLRYRSYSWMNKSASFTQHYYTLFISKDTNNRGIPVATYKKREQALEEAHKLEELFNLRFQATRI